MITEKCYWCGNNSTSKEHVPPLCLFPECKDIEGFYDIDFRRSLITVPSCDEHNLAKSHNDEYLMVCLGSKVGNNGIAYVQTNTKIKRAIERNPKLIDVQGEDYFSIAGRKFPVLLIRVDNYRLMNSFEAIARALVFYEFKFHYRGRCCVISDIFLSPDDQRSTSFQIASFSLISKERIYWRTPTKGGNPMIFRYQFSNADVFGTFTVALEFYERTVVYVIMSILNQDDFNQIKFHLQS